MDPRSLLAASFEAAKGGLTLPERMVALRKGSVSYVPCAHHKGIMTHLLGLHGLARGIAFSH